MHDGILIVSSPLTEIWPCWILLAYLVLILFCVSRQPAILQDTIHSLLSKMDRSYNDTNTDRLTNLLIGIVRVGLIAFVIDLMLPQQGFSILTYLMVAGAVAAFEICKKGITKMVSFVFELYRLYADPNTQYQGLWNLVAALFFPIILLGINYGTTPFFYWAIGIVMATYMLVLLIKMIQNYVTKPMSFVYILLYIVTIEVLPIASLIWAAQTL